MENKKKVAIGLGIAGLATVAIIAATKAKAAPPEEGPVTIGIEIIGPTGAVLARGPVALVSLIEGESYIVRITITNQTTKAGQPWAATLEVVILASTAEETLLPTTTRDEYFGPGETRVFDYPMFVPLGVIGLSGQIIAVVNDPTGVRLALAIESFTITIVEIIYGAEVVIGV